MYEDAGYVYAIRNTVNNRAYIGSTTNYKSRWHTHRSTLRRGVHHSFILQKAWDKYGEKAFAFELLVVCPRSQRIDYEKRLMRLEAYNVLRTPKETGVRGGWTHSDEFKAKMSKLTKGRLLTEEHKAKVGAALKGFKHTDSFKDRARERQLGVSPTHKTRQKLSSAIKHARKDEYAANAEAVKTMYASAVSGVPLSAVFAGSSVSRTTFYAHCKALGLPPLKRRKART